MSDNVVPLDEWGKRMLEELLFRAAERAFVGASGDELTVTVTFTLRADVEGDCIEISVPGSVESEILTRLPRPF
jgi:hypothetical protein